VAARYHGIAVHLSRQCAVLSVPRSEVDKLARNEQIGVHVEMSAVIGAPRDRGRRALVARLAEEPL